MLQDLEQLKNEAFEVPQIKLEHFILVVTAPRNKHHACMLDVIGIEYAQTEIRFAYELIFHGMGSVLERFDAFYHL